MNDLTEFNLEKLTQLYNSVGLKTRNMKFFTKWYYDTYRFAHLSSIDNQHLEQLCRDKTKLSVFAILIDDLADNYKTRNLNMLQKALQIPWNDSEKFHDKYLDTTKELWNDIINSVKNYPRFDEFKDLFYFDLSQFLTSINYGYLANSMDIANVVETKAHSYHNMMVLLFCDMDLMCSPNFDKKELGKLRPILHWVQDITHVGNILSTYQREIEEQDFSSPMISIALSEGVLDKETVKNNPEKTLKNLEYIIPYFKTRVEEDFQKIKDYANTVESVDINDFYQQTKKAYENFLRLQQYWKPNVAEIEEKEESSEPYIPEIPKHTSNWARM